MGLTGHLVLLPMSDVGTCAGCRGVGGGNSMVLCSLESLEGLAGDRGGGTWYLADLVIAASLERSGVDGGSGENAAGKLRR